jgi:hypothetical protein
MKFVTQKQLKNATSAGTTNVSSREVHSKQQHDKFPNTVNAVYSATVELTSGWTETDGVYTAKAKRVSYTGGTYNDLLDGEFDIYYPLQKASDGEPSLSEGDRCTVIRRGRWEVSGSGGGTTYARYGVTVGTFNAGTIADVRVYDGWNTNYRTVKAMIPPNYYQVAVAANTPCVIMPTNYTSGGITADWMIVSILYSSETTTP